LEKKVFTCLEVDIPHEAMVRMRDTGELDLGMAEALGTKIALTHAAGPKGDGSKAAFHFYSWLAIGVFAVSVYYSFADRWWWFIVGLFGMVVIWRSNKQSTGQNFAEAAYFDRDFYDRVLEVDGWLYKLDEKLASQYLKSK